MNRRDVLAVCGSVAAASAGCLGDAADGEADATSPGTADEPAGTPTATPALPPECPRSPEVEDLPERPTELNRQSAAEYLAAYEYALAPHREPATARLNFIEHVRTEEVDRGFRVHFFVEPLADSSTPASTPTTSTPIASETYSVAYFIDEHLIRRETRIGPTSYTGLRPEEAGTLVAC